MPEVAGDRADSGPPGARGHELGEERDAQRGGDDRDRTTEQCARKGELVGAGVTTDLEFSVVALLQDRRSEVIELSLLSRTPDGVEVVVGIPLAE